MSYSTNNSTTVTVTNFGARGDWLSDDTKAFQAAHDSLLLRGGGTIFVPKGNYLTSGYLNITGHNIGLVGEPELSWIRTAPSGDFKKINVSGASGFFMIGMSIDAGRTSGRNERYVPTVNLYSAPYFKISNCHLTHSEGLMTNIRGNTYCGLIENTLFEDFHIAIWANSNDIPSLPYNRISVLNNRFYQSWGLNTVGGQNFFGGVKFQNIGSEFDGVTTGGRSHGHIIEGNTFSGCSQMGVELFGYISDSIVANNAFDACAFGVSIAASSFNVNVSDNVFRACSNYGIELADAQNVVASNNVIYGATGGQFYNFGAAANSYLPLSGSICYTPVGIIANGVGRKPNFYSICDNTVVDCSDCAIKAYATDEVNIIGNTIYNRALSPGQCFNATASTNVRFSENNLYQLSTGSYFIFLDAASQSNSGITIRNNKLGGSVNQWGILYYNNNNTGANNNGILIEGNDTSAVKYCQLGMVNASSNPGIYVLHRNNFGQPFGSGYFISDGQIPEASVPLQTTAVVNGFQHYAVNTWYVPSGGITGNGIWLCAWSGYQGGKQNNVRLMVSTDYRYNGLYQDTEIWATMIPYGGGTDTLVTTPIVSASPVVQQIKTIAIPNEIRSAIWIKLRPTTTGAINAPVSLYYSVAQESAAGQQGFRGYSSYTEPIDTANNARLILDNISGGIEVYPGTYKFGGGMTLGGSGAVSLNSSRSGVLQLYSPENSSYGGQFSFGKRIANTSIALYDDLVGPTLYGLGIAPNQMRFHVDTSASRFGFFDAPSGNELVTIKGNGYVGIGTTTPNYTLSLGATLGKALALYENGGNNLYGLAAGGSGTSPDPYRLKVFSDGGESISITAAGNIGMGVINPGSKLHINGSLCLSGITTSTAANVGTAALPTNPVGFVTINITGGNFKIPYYNV